MKNYVLKAAILGVVLSEALLLLAKTMYVLHKSGNMSDFTYDNLSGIGFILAIPTAFIRSPTGYEGILLNEYVINGLFGAILFSLVAVWRFKKRDQHGC